MKPKPSFLTHRGYHESRGSVRSHRCGEWYFQLFPQSLTLSRNRVGDMGIPRLAWPFSVATAEVESGLLATIALLRCEPAADQTQCWRLRGQILKDNGNGTFQIQLFSQNRTQPERLMEIK